MGVGKSTIGRKLASHLGFKFVDTDEMFEEKYKLSIESFFSKYNEKLFREFENKILESTFALNNTIIATGGGTPCYLNAMDEINKNGISVYLEMPVDAIVTRLENTIKPRPLVKDKSHEALTLEVERMLNERVNIYEKANLIFNATNPDIERLVKTLAS